MTSQQQLLRSSFWIFLKCANTWSDTDLLHDFGLSGYERAIWDNDPARRMTLEYARTVAFGTSGEWISIADDTFYTLWHMRTTRPTLARLAASCDVFAYSLGDCDDSFELIYYRDGLLARKLVVIDGPGGGQQEVYESIGEPLQEESKTLDYGAFRVGVDTIGRSLGFATSFSIDELRIYSKPYSR